MCAVEDEVDREMGMRHQNPVVDAGSSVDSAGDVDGDGIGDVIVGANFNLASGSATIFSGATGLVLWVIHGGWAGSQFGWSVAGVRCVKHGRHRPDVNAEAMQDSAHGRPADVVGDDFRGKRQDGCVGDFGSPFSGPWVLWRVAIH